MWDWFCSYMYVYIHGCSGSSVGLRISIVHRLYQTLLSSFIVLTTDKTSVLDRNVSFPRLPYLDSVPQCVHACEWLIGRVGRMIPTFVLFCSNKETTPTFFHRIIRLMLDNFPQFFYWIQIREGTQICFLKRLVLNVLCEIKMHWGIFWIPLDQ